MEKEFLANLAEILELQEGEVTPEMKLGEDVWDSLALLAVAAAFDSVYDQVVPVKKIEECTTVQELLDLVEERTDNE